jgi:uncharacterized membrane protein HdeD (DUF308 family)
MNPELRDRAAGRLEAFSDTVSQYRTWFMILGVALIVLGIIAVIFPLATTIAVKVFLGWIILIGGLVTAFHAFSTQKWSAFLYNLLVGLLYVIVGAWLAFLPLSGVITLTVLLAMLFILQGVLQAALAFRLKPHDGWGWILVAGLVAIAAGFMLITGLPSTATWAIGLLAGISMISSGWAYLSIALRVGKAQDAVRDRLK